MKSFKYLNQKVLHFPTINFGRGQNNPLPHIEY